MCVQNRILVTGATGVLGKAIVKAAVADGLLVRQAGDVESIAGRAPITFDAFARATAASWR